MQFRCMGGCLNGYQYDWVRMWWESETADPGVVNENEHLLLALNLRLSSKGKDSFSEL
jgi:hypothetical protein